MRALRRARLPMTWLLASFAREPVVSVEPSAFHIAATTRGEEELITFTVSYRVGELPIERGGGIQVGFGYYAGNESNPLYGENFGYLFGPSRSLTRIPTSETPQVDDPEAPSFVSATCSVPGARLAVSVVQRVVVSERIVQVVTDRALPPGTVISVTYGDTSHGSPGFAYKPQPGAPRVIVLQDSTGSGDFRPETASFPVLLFTGEAANTFLVQGPVVAERGVPARIALVAAQRSGELRDESFLPVEDFTGVLEVSTSDPEAGAPDSVTFEAEHRGVREIPVTFPRAGPQWVTVSTVPKPSPEAQAPVASVRARGNTILVVEPDDPRTRVYCGDVQRHSCQGGHAALPDRMCWQQLFDLRQDFGTVVQHSPWKFAAFGHAKSVALQFQKLVDPDEARFVAFPGYEWSGEGMHRTVMLRDLRSANPALLNRAYRGRDSPEPIEAFELEEFLAGIRKGSTPQIALPHHTTLDKPEFPDEPFPWGGLQDDAGQPLMEIHSGHGSCERSFKDEEAVQDWDYPIHKKLGRTRPPEEESSFRDALRKGHVFGVVAGSDKHNYWALSGAEEDGGMYGRSGLAFVHGDPAIPSLRRRIWDGLTVRRTYATTGARIYLSFSAEGHAMGSIVETPTAPLFQVQVLASGLGRADEARLLRLEIFRDGADRAVLEKIYDPPLTGDELSWRDPEPPEDDALHSYYLRVVQDDHHVAWSSPIWVRR